MSAGSDDDVIVKMEADTKVFGDIKGQSGVVWEGDDTQTGGDD